MDKRSILAIFLVGILTIAYAMYQQSVSVRPDEAKDTTTKTENSTTVTPQTETPEPLAESQPAEVNEEAPAANAGLTDSALTISKYGNIFAPFASGREKTITIETDLVKAKISSKGAVIKKWFLHKYQTWYGQTSQLIWDPDGVYYMQFVSMEGKKIDSRDLYFDFGKKAKSSYKLSGSDSLVLNARLDIAPGKAIVKRMVFYGDRYIIDTDISLENLDAVLPNRGYDLIWTDGIKFQEENSVDEATSAVAMVSRNGEIEELDADEDVPVELSASGITDYVAVKTKYFGAAIIPMPYRSFDGTVDMTGSRKMIQDEGQQKRYDVSIRVPYQGGTESSKFRMFVGPLEYDRLEELELSDMINMGWRILIRPIGEFFMLPIFNFIHSFVPNYGISILIFSLLMKLLLYPLSVQQMRSSQKMKLVQPEITKAKEKYPDDNQKQQQETMRIYSEYGINPAGGCLPLLLQMPILYALWSILRSHIDLRQADFALWITDLSRPDIVLDFGFSILGIKYFSGLALLMGVTMFLQQKMTITDPRQKGMVYMMPIMFTLMFSYFPSGLNLYYFMFNLLSIVQQAWINNFSKNRPTLSDLKRAPKKEGWLQKKMREAQEMAAAQGKTIPGQKPNRPNNRPNNNRPKKKK